MALYIRLIYYSLITEVVIYLLTLIPLTFIPLRFRRTSLDTAGKLVAHPLFQRGAQVLLFVVALTFADTLLRLYNMEVEFHGAHDEAGAGDKHKHTHTETAYEDLAHKSKKFYAHRNLYLSLFTLFMVLVLYRRFNDLYIQVTLEERIKVLESGPSSSGSSSSSTSAAKVIPQPKAATGNASKRAAAGKSDGGDD
ncbi:B-cell receptor-associated protein 31-like-domain-containing protein [Cladochytrium replicatum]|nr:B-cell receptor-associated protein 31-like-domain-containing protein [Cladochytrium replicatum]